MRFRSSVININPAKQPPLSRRPRYRPFLAQEQASFRCRGIELFIFIEPLEQVCLFWNLKNLSRDELPGLRRNCSRVLPKIVQTSTNKSIPYRAQLLDHGCDLARSPSRQQRSVHEKIVSAVAHVSESPADTRIRILPSQYILLSLDASSGSPDNIQRAPARLVRRAALKP